MGNFTFDESEAVCKGGIIFNSAEDAQLAYHKAYSLNKGDMITLNVLDQEPIPAIFISFLMSQDEEGEEEWGEIDCMANAVGVMIETYKKEDNYTPSLAVISPAALLKSVADEGTYRTLTEEEAEKVVQETVLAHNRSMLGRLFENWAREAVKEAKAMRKDIEAQKRARKDKE